MRVKGNAEARFDIEKDIKGHSWVHDLDWSRIEWDRFNLSTTYPKGSPTTNKTLTFHQLLNSLAEQVLTVQKGRFKTLSEVFRCALHLGMQVLWFLCIHDKGEMLKESRGQSFFNFLARESEIFYRAQILEGFEKQIQLISDMVNAGKLLPEDGERILKEGIGNLKNSDKNYVLKMLKANANNSKEGNIFSLKRAKYEMAGIDFLM